MCLAQYNAFVHNVARITPGRTEVARSYLNLTEIIHSAVFIATRYGLKGAGIESRWG